MDLRKCCDEKIAVKMLGDCLEYLILQVSILDRGFEKLSISFGLYFFKSFRLRCLKIYC